MKEYFEIAGSVVTQFTSGKPEAIVLLLLLLLVGMGFCVYKGVKAGFIYVKEKDVKHKEEMNAYIDRLFKLAEQTQASNNAVASQLSAMAQSLRDLQRGGR